MLGLMRFMRIPMNIHTLATLLASTFLSLPAFAQNSITEEKILEACAGDLSSAYLDRDGWFILAEADATFDANYALLDGDADGAVTLWSSRTAVQARACVPNAAPRCAKAIRSIVALAMRTDTSIARYGLASPRSSLPRCR